jgi:hypothetical protein
MKRLTASVAVAVTIRKRRIAIYNVFVTPLAPMNPLLDGRAKLPAPPIQLRHDSCSQMRMPGWTVLF